MSLNIHANLEGPNPPAGNGRRLMVTGASGFVGAHVCQAAAGQWQVVGICHRHPHKAVLPPDRLFCEDLTQWSVIRRLLEKVQPTAIIHAAAEARPDRCQKDPLASRKLNVETSIRMAKWAAASDRKMIMVSTDLVFDGRRPPYRESDRPAPVGEYGRQKAQAEAALREMAPNVTIARLPLILGTSPGGRPNFSSVMCAQLRAQRPLRLFVDEVRTPVDGPSAARGLLLALRQPQTIIHLGGRTPISRYQMGLALAQYLGVAQPVIEPVCVDPNRAADVSLDSRRAYRLGYQPKGLNDILKALAQSEIMIQKESP